MKPRVGGARQPLGVTAGQARVLGAWPNTEGDIRRGRRALRQSGHTMHGKQRAGPGSTPGRLRGSRSSAAPRDCWPDRWLPAGLFLLCDSRSDFASGRPAGSVPSSELRPRRKTPALGHPAWAVHNRRIVIPHTLYPTHTRTHTHTHTAGLFPLQRRGITTNAPAPPRPAPTSRRRGRTSRPSARASSPAPPPAPACHRWSSPWRQPAGSPRGCSPCVPATSASSRTSQRVSAQPRGIRMDRRVSGEGGGEARSTASGVARRHSPRTCSRTAARSG